MTTASNASRSHRRAEVGRIAPVLRSVVQDDFFAWVSILAEALEVTGMSYRDDIALRLWQQLDLSKQPEQARQGLDAIVADRSGNLVGLALITPSLSLTTGGVALDVHLAYVQRAARDETAARALVDEVHRRARDLAATKVRWFSTGETLHTLSGATPLQSASVFESDPSASIAH